MNEIFSMKIYVKKDLNCRFCRTYFPWWRKDCFFVDVMTCFSP